MADVPPLNDSATTHRPDGPSPGAARSVPRRAASFSPIVAICVAMLATPALVRAVVRQVWPAGGAPSYLPVLERTRTRQPFDRGPIRELRTRRPAFVFIGDSMLRSRIDRQYLDTMLPHGWRVSRLSRHATGSAYWWLVLRNYVVPSRHPPRRVFIFFRDDNLTDPLWRLTGGSRSLVDRAARKLEPELNEIIARRLKGPWHRVHYAVDRVYEGDALGADTERSLSRFAASLAAPHRRPDPFLRRVNQMFDLEELRVAEQADVGRVEVAEQFDGLVETSILPRMVALAAEHELSLVFVRVQRRPDRDGRVEQSPALRAYMDQLRRYLESHGALLVDFTGDAGVRPEWYGNGDHIAPQHRRDWTTLFHQRVMHLLR